MKKFLPLISTIFIALLILACNDDSPSIDHNLLTTSPWKRVRRIDLQIRNKDTVYKDNRFITNSCNLNAYLQFNKDNSVSYDRNCESGDPQKKVFGTWKLNSDIINIHFQEFAGTDSWFLDTARITKLTPDSLRIYWTRSRINTYPDNTTSKNTTTVIQYFVH